METFNDEVVNEERGKEEYVHLKSLEDEIEFMDSDMPKGRGGRPADEDLPSADVDADDKHGKGQEDDERDRNSTERHARGPEQLYEDDGGAELTEEELAYYEEAVLREMERERERMLASGYTADTILEKVQDFPEVAMSSSPAVNTGDDDEDSEGSEAALAHPNTKGNRDIRFSSYDDDID